MGTPLVYREENMGKHNLLNERFGKLIVLKEDGKSKSGDITWLCKCDCGKFKSIRASALYTGNTTSCGCIQREIVAEMGRQTKLNLVGQRFNKLVVVSPTEEKTKCGHYKWVCKCDCGNEKIVAGNSLKSGDVMSCGCIRSNKFGRKHRKDNMGIIKNDLPLYKTYNKHLYCECTVIVLEDGLELLGIKCSYCGDLYRPTRTEVKNRLLFLKGATTAENRFYCSEGCKRACPIYRQVRYPKGFKKATSREIQPELRQLVLKRDNYTCQYKDCGKTKYEVELHCHHIMGVAQNPIESADMNNCIILCKEHHKEIHKTPGCSLNELRCVEEE
jgi:hypothetical protein